MLLQQNQPTESVQPVALSKNDILLMLGCAYHIPRNIGKSDAEIKEIQRRQVVHDLLSVNAGKDIMVTADPLLLMQQAFKRIRKQYDDGKTPYFVDELKNLHDIQGSERDRVARPLTQDDDYFVTDMVTDILKNGAFFSKEKKDSFSIIRSYADNHIDVGENIGNMAMKTMIQNRLDMGLLYPPIPVITVLKSAYAACVNTAKAGFKR